MQPQFPGQLFIEERSGKQGLGTAYIHGFRWALARQYQYIFEMDADFSHNPKDLIRLYDACANGGADVSVGSRYVPGGRRRTGRGTGQSSPTAHLSTYAASPGCR